MHQLQANEKIFVFTGPDGSGRKTIAEMAGMTLDMKQVISYTTRKRRPSEIDGEDYYFVTREAFQAAVANHEFIEALEIDHNFYGIKKAEIEQSLELADSVYIILNRYGAQILKELYGNQVVRLFIYASREAVIERQREYGLTEDDVARHIAHYEEDMAYLPQCEYAFENVDLAHTSLDVCNKLEKYLNRQMIDKD